MVDDSAGDRHHAVSAVWRSAAPDLVSRSRRLPAPDLPASRVPRLSALGYLVTEARDARYHNPSDQFGIPSRVPTKNARTCGHASHAARGRFAAQLPLATPQLPGSRSVRDPGTHLESPDIAPRSSARLIQFPDSKSRAAAGSAAKFNGVLSIIAARRHDKTLHVRRRRLWSVCPSTFQKHRNGSTKVCPVSKCQL